MKPIRTIIQFMWETSVKYDYYFIVRCGELEYKIKQTGIWLIDKSIWRDFKIANLRLNDKRVVPLLFRLLKQGCEIEAVVGAKISPSKTPSSYILECCGKLFYVSIYSQFFSKMFQLIRPYIIGVRGMFFRERVKKVFEDRVTFKKANFGYFEVTHEGGRISLVKNTLIDTFDGKKFDTLPRKELLDFVLELEEYNWDETRWK